MSFFPKSYCLGVAVLCLIGVQFSAPAHAYADTLVTYTLGTDNGVNFYDMDDSGHVVLFRTGGGQYFTFFNGQNPVTSLVAPSIVSDNGTPCTPAVPAGYTVQKGVCNNGRDAFVAYDAAHTIIPGLFYNSSNPILLGPGRGDFLFMDGLGDFVWNDAGTELWYEAVNLDHAPAPEPASILLFLTGVLGTAAMYRRTQTA